MSGTIFFIYWITWIFRVFSCSHLLSNRKQSVMSRRAQESTPKEGSAVAKPRPMSFWCQGTSWVRRRILRKIWVIQTAWWIKNWINVVFHPATNVFSREATRWHSIFQHQEIGRRHESSNSARGGEDIQFGRSKLHFHNMQISDHRYFEKVFKNQGKKLNLAGDAPVIGIEALKTNVLLWVTIYVDYDESRHSSWTKLRWKIWKYTGTRTSRNFRIFSISPRSWYWTISQRFWMWQRSTGHLPPWTTSRLCHDHVITWTKAKVRVYSDSVLC